MNANNKNQKEDEGPQTVNYFRPWETQTAERPNATVSQPVVSPISGWYYWYLPYTFMITTQPLPAICPDGATNVSTPQPLSRNQPTIPTKEAAASQNAREEPKYEVIGENKEKIMKKIAQLSREQVEGIIPYRREMARTFQRAKERTPAEQRKRDKNTEACRLSRRRKKLQEIDLLWPKLSKYGKAKFCELFGDYLKQ